MRGRSPRTASLSLAASHYNQAIGDIDGGVLDFVFGGAAETLGAVVDEKTQRLERALKLIIALSGVAATCGLVGLFRGRG